MERFTLFFNSEPYEPRCSRGTPALDLIRGEKGLLGTKEGCREGDCGACAVLLGGPEEGGIRYRAVPSCLLASGDLERKHLVTIEGLGPDLSPVQKAFLEENASQCGFCTPGFIMALTAWLCDACAPSVEGALRAADGNLCRCTGYGSIRRAAERLSREFSGLPLDPARRMEILAERGVLPSSVLAYRTWLETYDGKRHHPEKPADGSIPVVAGGTDYYVRNPEPPEDFSPFLVKSHPSARGIGEVPFQGASALRIGAAVTAAEFFSSPLVREQVPGIEAFEREFASTLIRNVATLGGNIANASPVGDLSSMLLGLGAWVEIGPEPSRIIALEDFFISYKKTALAPGEFILSILLPSGGKDLRFSFAKISKRRNLDIAAVNVSISWREAEGRIRGARVSAGGVAPTPILLHCAAEALEGEPSPLGAQAVRSAAQAAMDEIAPIGDVRGSAEYRRRMTGRLVIATLLRLFPDGRLAEELYP